MAQYLRPAAAERAVVNDLGFRERPRFPTSHARHRRGHCIFPAARERSIAADFLVTLPSKQLSGAGRIGEPRPTGLQAAAYAVPIDGAADAESRLVGEAFESATIVVGLESDIRIKVAEEIEIQAPHS